MARRKTPDGRRVPVSFKLTEAEASLVDSLRGDLERGPWIRAMALESARRLQDSGIRERLGVSILTDGRQPPGIVSLISRGTDADGNPQVSVAHMDVGPGGLAPEPAARKPRAKQPCEHRRPPGSYCRSCERLV